MLVKKIAKNFDFYLKNGNTREMVLELPFEHLKAFLGRDDLMVESEDLVFKLVIDYIKKRENLGDLK